MSSPSLPLSDVVNVVVQVAAQNPVVPTFNVGLVIGPSAIIPASTRLRTYTALSQMLTDGFSTSSPEYIAAQLLFSQSPAPQSFMVGRQDLTSIQTWALSSGATGSGYQVGDVLAIVQGGASGGQIAVATVNGSGAVTSATLTPTPLGIGQGTGYSVANTLGTTGGHGTGAQVNVLSIGDTALQAVQYCRLASSTWYACGVTSAVTADHLAIAAYIEATQPASTYFFTTSDAAALTGTGGNIFATMKAAFYKRDFGLYSTTQGGNAPNNAYSWAAAMGVAMGLNTGLANSAFTMFGKTLVGVIPEPLTQSQVNTIQGNNGNLYLNFGGAYQLVTAGTTPTTNYFWDTTLFLDILTAQLQFAEMNVLVDNPEVPQTDAGQQQFIHAANQACAFMATLGFIGPGVWNGVQILNLNNGDAMPSGYLVQSPPYRTQLASDRAARKAMPVYVAIIRAGAAQSLLVGVYIQ